MKEKIINQILFAIVIGVITFLVAQNIYQTFIPYIIGCCTGIIFWFAIYFNSKEKEKKSTQIEQNYSNQVKEINAQIKELGENNKKSTSIIKEKCDQINNNICAVHEMSQNVYQLLNDDESIADLIARTKEESDKLLKCIKTETDSMSKIITQTGNSLYGINKEIQNAINDDKKEIIDNALKLNLNNISKMDEIKNNIEANGKRNDKLYTLIESNTKESLEIIKGIRAFSEKEEGHTNSIELTISEIKTNIEANGNKNDELYTLIENNTKESLEIIKGIRAFSEKEEGHTNSIEMTISEIKTNIEANGNKNDELYTLIENNNKAVLEIINEIKDFSKREVENTNNVELTISEIKKDITQFNNIIDKENEILKILNEEKFKCFIDELHNYMVTQENLIKDYDDFLINIKNNINETIENIEERNRNIIEETRKWVSENIENIERQNKILNESLEKAIKDTSEKATNLIEDACATLADNYNQSNEEELKIIEKLESICAK